MYARVSRIEGQPERVEEALKSFREAPLPFSEKDGFKGAYLLVDRKAGKLLTMTLWESQAALEASAAAANRIRQEGANSAGAATSPVVEVYEVAEHP